MRPLSYLLLVTLALATGGQAVVHGNRNGYRYNGPSHKYLPAEGAPSTDAVTTTGHWQPQVHEEQREREPEYLGNRQEHWQHQQSGHQGSSSSLGHQQQHQQGHRQEQQGHLQHAHSLQEVEYLIHQQRPQGFSQYQGNRQLESSYGQQQQQQQQHENHQQQHSENHWDSSSHHHQQQGPHKQQQQQPQQPESHWDSAAYQQQGPHKQQQQQTEKPWEQEQHGSRQQQQQQLQNYWENSFGQQQKENNWESSYGQQGSQQQPENHWSGPLSSNKIHGSQGSDRWQPSSHSSYPLQSLDLLPVAHAHANSQKTLARPTNHVNQIPGYTLSSNPEHERFIGLDAADNRLLTQSLPFQSPSAPFRPGSNHHQQHQQHQQGHSHNFLQMQSQSYELPPTQHTQHGWVASQSANSHANEPNRQFQPPYY